MKKNRTQKFIVLFLLSLFAYSLYTQAQEEKGRQITMEFRNEGLPSVFKRLEKIYRDIKYFLSTMKSVLTQPQAKWKKLQSTEY